MRTSDQANLQIAALVEQLARRVQNLCFTKDLAPVQWSAMRYFAQAGQSARTVTGLTAYSGVNQSSATRTVQLLAEKGLIEIQREGRFKRISLSEKGRQTLDRDPLKRLAYAIDALDPGAQVVLRDLLAALLLELHPRPFKEQG